MTNNIYKKEVKPLLYSYNKKEISVNRKWDEVKTIALLTDPCDNKLFIKFIKKIIIVSLSENRKILLRISEINDNILNYIKIIMSGSSIVKMYPSIKRNLLMYIPGMIISTVDNCDKIDAIFEYWGNVDYIQFLVLNSDSVESLFKLLEDDVYELSMQNLLSFLPHTKFILTDSGDGNEAEIIYHKDHGSYLNECINKAIEDTGVNLINII